MLTFGRTSSRYGPYDRGPAPGSYYNPDSKRVHGSRLLYHSGLIGLSQKLLSYPYLPDTTLNFTHDVLAPREIALAKTLSASVLSKFRQVKSDVVIKEIFRAGGGLSADWKFFHTVLRMYLNDPDWDNGEYLLWRPFDRTHKAFLVSIIGLSIDGEDYNSEFRVERKARLAEEVDSPGVYRSDVESVRWFTSEFQIHLMIRAEATPQASVFAIGGSDTEEPGLFNMNEVEE